MYVYTYIIMYVIWQHSVNMVQVLEHLTGKGVSNDEALEVYTVYCILKQ